MRPRVFVSYASEDRDVAKPIALSLKERGFDVWFDEFMIRVGDSLMESIDRGLRECDFGVVLLSQEFFMKQWPKRELAALLAREDSNAPSLFPVWHNLTVSDVLNYWPTLADRLAVSTSEGLDELVDRIVGAVRVSRDSWKEFDGTEFLVPFTITGSRLFRITLDVLARQHGFTLEDAEGRLTLAVYEDVSGLDERVSRFTLSDGVHRRLRQSDIQSVLSDQSFVPRGYSVHHLGMDQDEIPEEFSALDENAIDVREISTVHFTAVLDQQYVREDELVGFLKALVQFNSGLPYDSHGDLWQNRDSPGRVAVRRLLNTGRLSSIAPYLSADWDLSWRKQPNSDYRRFCLARAVVYELRANGKGTVSSQLSELLLSEQSPLNEYWKNRLKARLDGQPIWAYDKELK
ncbi:toll/interleukin-1 receptor domain-containing protein [Streptomyces scabiei]|uniref:toll/interleukin-1 receptor domain-containing protein n=1 Tax=Streptomyces scabiei TaxID=1930 RepID=UPI000A3D556C|nr:toll/interleukin-1 receptor domain-containing protein [Streptomyces scabiei]